MREKEEGKTDESATDQTTCYAKHESAECAGDGLDVQPVRIILDRQKVCKIILGA